MNVKGIAHYRMKPISMLLISTNQPVVLQDSQDGLVRRILEVT